MIILLFLALFTSTSYGQVGNTCPVAGSGKHPHPDSAKNRSVVPVKYDPIDFDYMASLPISNQLKWDSAVSLTGYVLKVEDGGKESCNCGSAIYKDTHIYIVKQLGDLPVQAIIVEATPRFRLLIGTTADLKKLTGKHVVIRGYLFMDSEHKANSRADNGKGLLWRSTCEEIHPLTEKIEVLP